MKPLSRKGKKRAIIYTRVSTDEQAEKGYSLRDQENRLTQYCEQHDIEIVNHFQDDASAKTFDKRPAFQELLKFLDATPVKIDFLLVLKWDRFSRNIAQAFGMIEKLSKMGVKVDAIEQSLDDDIPENLILRAVFLAAPQVENERRARNTRQGMRRAKKEGRWMAKPPKGYKSSRDENNRSIIIPGDDARFIKLAFKEMAKGVYTMEEVRRDLIQQGFKCSKNQFTQLLKNPIYYGKILVKAYKDDPEELVDGIHEPLIPPRLFHSVQSILNRKNVLKPGKPVSRRKELPLRGLLICRRCGGNLTGSRSSGNGGGYYYYHCQKKCKESFRADKANKVFLEYLNAIKPAPEVALLYLYIMEDIFHEKEGDRSAQLKRIDAAIKKEESRLEPLDEKYLDGKLDDDTYARLTSRCKKKIASLRSQRKVIEDTETNFDRYARYGLTLITDLAHYYQQADLEIKQKIVGLIFPGKLIYENGKYRTNGMNRAMRLLMGKKADFRAKKEGLTANLDDQSFQVALLGLEPRTS